MGRYKKNESIIPRLYIIVNPIKQTIDKMKMINLTRTPSMLFSKSMTHIKHILLQQNDLLKYDIPHKYEKIYYNNMAYMILLYAEWQIFIQNVTRMGVERIRSLHNLSDEDAEKLNQKTQKALSEFGNPTCSHINKLIKDTLGIKNISSHWAYDNYSTEESKRILREISEIRNKIAHEANIGGHELSLEKCFEYMEHLFQLSQIIEQVIVDTIK